MRRLLASLAGALALSACASTPEPSSPASPREAADTGLDRMERLALTANRCWIRSGDPAFAAYSLAPELSSFSGRPRFLLVPKGRVEERPLLVVEGRAGSSAVETFGPALDGSAGARIRRDIASWSAGASACVG